MATFVGVTPLHDSANIRLLSPGFLPPTTVSTSTATTGGTLAAGTYYYRVTALNAAGESIGSRQVSQVTTGATSTVTVTYSAVSGATSYRVYRGTTDGFTTGVFFADADGSPFTDTGAAGTAGSYPTTTLDGHSDWKSVADGTIIIVDVDNTNARRALNRHWSIGQLVVAAVNNRTKTAGTLPTNT